jgi:hypothetical protein
MHIADRVHATARSRRVHASGGCTPSPWGRAMPRNATASISSRLRPRLASDRFGVQLIARTARRKRWRRRDMPRSAISTASLVTPEYSLCDGKDSRSVGGRSKVAAASIPSRWWLTTVRSK